MLRKTKIICTMGPTVEDVEVIKKLILAGMNIARFNFSHGNHAYHAEMIEKVRSVSKETGHPVALMLDTKGPEIRTGKIKDNGKITLTPGASITLTTDEVDGTSELLSISYKQLPYEVRPGGRIYIADGLIDLEVKEIDGNTIRCVIQSGGIMGSRKNVNVPGVKSSLPAITEKDKTDIHFGMKAKIDFIAASFIRKPEDVLEIKDMVSETNIQVIAKIEDQEGLDNIDEIIRVSGGIMIARGDLGVQLQTEKIPLAQKRMIKKCNDANKPVITATQMLDSMIQNPKPTRAELTDVANAIFDGTDAVMLSGETANGAHPVLAVDVMDRIAKTVESSPEYMRHTQENFFFSRCSENISVAVARSACVVANDIGATAILTPTLRGNTPRFTSKFRPAQSIIAATTSETVQRQLLIYWGIYPILTRYVHDSDRMIQNALHAAMKKGYVNRFDKVVTVAGIPLNSPIMMNMIRIHVLGNILARGQDGFGTICSGKIVKAKDFAEAFLSLKQTNEEILLTYTVDEDYKGLIRHLKGLVLQDSSKIPPDELKSINPELVFISKVNEAMDKLENGLIVSLDGNEKVIYEGVVD